MDEGLRSAVESISVGRLGRPREFFVIKPESTRVTIAGVRVPDRELGARKIPVWHLESRAEVNRIIGELEEARDSVFPSDDSKLKRAMSDILWEAYCAGVPDCILTTREGRDEVIEKILDLAASQ
jgi:hypothetical protein